MDPKTAQNLDPKLREVYERVMGTTTTPQAKPHVPEPSSVSKPVQMTPPQPAAQTTATSQPTSAINYEALGGIKPLASSPVTPTLGVSSQTVTDTPSNVPSLKSSPATFGVVNAPQNDKKTPSPDSTEKKGSLMKKLLILIGIPLFVIVYTVVWIVVFGVELPFLSL